MSTRTTNFERQNLEAHVDLCAERYRVLEEKVNKIDEGLEQVRLLVHALREDSRKSMEDMRAENMKSSNQIKTAMLGAAATVIAGVLSTIIALIML